MKVSRRWLQKYFDTELPSTQALADALTFHAFEIEETYAIGDDEVLDIKVTPNRGHDCLSHRGIAKELAAILNLPFAHDPLSAPLDVSKRAENVLVAIDSPLCPRYIAGHITGVRVGPSPKWLKDRLEAIGQRSINNIVDATNFVMFNLGQPLHAFDAGRLALVNDRYAIAVREARDGEILLALDGNEYELSRHMLVIGDANNGVSIGIAGVKGGMPASITEETRDIIVESANFDGVSVRKTAKQLGLRTDASSRFEQVIAPKLAAYGMQSVVELIQKLAGGELQGYTDVHTAGEPRTPVTVTTDHINRVLGMHLTGAEVADALVRLGLPYKEEGGEFAVVPPFERLDLTIAEDLIEEVARIVGYDKVPATLLPPASEDPHVNTNFYWAEHVRAKLQAEGYSEVYTSVFSDDGERLIANKMDSVRPHLRTSLIPGLKEALAKNTPNKDVLGVGEIKLFEIGTVWQGGEETLMVGMIGEKEPAVEKPLADYMRETPTTYDILPLSHTNRFVPFSKYPHIARDVAAWTPQNSELSTGQAPEDVMRHCIGEAAGPLLVHTYLFDRFEKNGRLSLGFRLIFQSFERTLTEAEVNTIMDRVYEMLRDRGYEIR